LPAFGNAFLCLQSLSGFSPAANTGVARKAMRAIAIAVFILGRLDQGVIRFQLVSYGRRVPRLAARKHFDIASKADA
jgi:hypothetical protein